MPKTLHYDFVTLNPIVDSTPSHFSATIGRVGVFPYFNGHTLEYRLRPAAHVLSDYAVAQYNDLLCVVDHQAFETTTDRAIGIVKAVSIDEDRACVDGILTIWGKQALRLIDSGINQLSPGYYCSLVYESGEWDGQHYDCVQTDYLFDHLAIIEQARQGAEVAIHAALDSRDGVSVMLDHTHAIALKSIILDTHMGKTDTTASATVDEVGGTPSQENESSTVSVSVPEVVTPTDEIPDDQKEIVTELLPPTTTLNTNSNVGAIVPKSAGSAGVDGDAIASADAIDVSAMWAKMDELMTAIHTLSSTVGSALNTISTQLMSTDAVQVSEPVTLQPEAIEYQAEPPVVPDVVTENVVSLEAATAFYDSIAAAGLAVGSRYKLQLIIQGDSATFAAIAQELLGADAGSVPSDPKMAVAILQGAALAKRTITRQVSTDGVQIAGVGIEEFIGDRPNTANHVTNPLAALNLQPAWMLPVVDK
jgi:hypothetical protein